MVSKKIKEIGTYCLVIIIIVGLASALIYIMVDGVGSTHYGGTFISGIVDNVTFLPDQGDRFDVFLVNFTDRKPRLMFLPEGYNITLGFKYWFQGEYYGDYYQAHTVIGTFRQSVFTCMAVYDNPGHKALYVTKGIHITYADHYVFPPD